ncbi:MAG: LOG family protein [Phycisphaeraceae bacterium]
MPAPHSQSDERRLAELEQLVRDFGADPDAELGMRIRELLHTSLKLIGDEADLGEVKLISRALKELRYALKVFRRYRHVPKVSIFGSARTREDAPAYQAALAFSKNMAGQGWMVITGAGDGIMRAGHGGAGREASFGVAIRLPFETNANDYIVGDPKLITFRYFFTRKLVFIWQSHAIVLFPGGFGTHDEGYEALTLIQTGKAPLQPVVMVDQPGGNYWRHWDAYVRAQLLATGMISPADLSLYHVTDDAEEAARHVLHFYRNYHSQRFVDDDMVLRIARPLTPAQLDTLNGEFADLVVSGHITQGDAEPPEDEYLDLPRLRWTFTRRDYGRLRQMIDRINDFDAETNPDAPRTPHLTVPPNTLSPAGPTTGGENSGNELS